MYNKILVPLDGTKRAETILPHVEAMAQAFGSILLFLEVLEPLPLHASAVAPEVLVEGATHRSQEVRSYVSELAAHYRDQGLSATSLVRRGPVVETILETAAAEHVELIAMASHAHVGLARVIYGSVAADVLHRTHIPMLLIHAEDGS